MTNINQSLFNFWKFAFAIMAIAIICFSIIIVLFNHFVNRTIAMLVSMSDSVIAGHLEERIDASNENCIEIRKVAESYNSMLDNIQKLKLDIYEERIQKKNFQLYFLKSQIAPHFLINCLNMISYLADGTEENTKILKTMITTLSGHLRYTLTTKDNVPLYQEIEYLNNYVELTKLRFPNCITYETEFDETAMDAGVFPILLIGFVENVFKHNLIMGESLIIKCKSKRYQEKGEERLHFTIIDSGEGYSDDFLEDFYNDNIKDSECIGIKNVENRLKLYYDDSAYMKLSNEEGMGARTDIDIPYIEYK
ncbi:MAG: histidine kinase [Pseudobutyrivibrio sp.]|nr:histidine kinase [Pseudobutyrivibrio sp.]